MAVESKFHQAASTVGARLLDFQALDELGRGLVSALSHPTGVAADLIEDACLVSIGSYPYVLETQVGEVQLHTNTFLTAGRQAAVAFKFFHEDHASCESPVYELQFDFTGRIIYATYPLGHSEVPSSEDADTLKEFAYFLKASVLEAVLEGMIR
ncbi:hypothetical protein [Herbaspirillum rubrisubalbicans]|nr:hypothetical protein [Herbaspirillum rubrisubalbicans]